METSDPAFVKDILDAMSSLVGDKIAETILVSIKRFNGTDDIKAFFDSSSKVFSELVGEDIVEKKLNPLRERYIKIV